MLCRVSYAKYIRRRVDPFSPTSDQNRISPYFISMMSSRQVMRIKKDIN